MVIFVSSRVDSLKFKRDSALPRGTSLYHQAMWEVFSLFLGADVSDN